MRRRTGAPRCAKQKKTNARAFSISATVPLCHLVLLGRMDVHTHSNSNSTSALASAGSSNSSRSSSYMATVVPSALIKVGRAIPLQPNGWLSQEQQTRRLWHSREWNKNNNPQQLFSLLRRAHPPNRLPAFPLCCSFPAAGFLK
jgi:hypothetical protein